MADNKIELMKIRSTFKTLCILSVLSASLSCKAVPATLPGDLQPDEQQSIVCKTVAEMITNYNYKKVPLNDSLSAIVYNRYIKALDENHNYFLASDIKSFEGLKYTLDNDIIDGNLNNVFLIFNTYKKRYKERVQYSLTQVAKSFDFKKKDEFIYDREKLPWITSSTAMNELWTKRVKYDLLNLKLASPDTAKNKETLRKRYENLARQLDKLNSQDVFQTFMDALTNAIDPHTNYFNPTNAQAFSEDMARSFEGIGARLQLENEVLKLGEIIPGGPAFKSKLLNTGDRIIGVAQGNGEFEDITGWRIENSVAKIKGPKGTTVRLKIIPVGQEMSAKPVIISLVREKIIMEDQSAKKKVETVKSNGTTYKIGIISLPAFYADFNAAKQGDKNFKSTTRDVRLLIDTLKTKDKVDAIVMDLRSNGGGSLTEAINLTGLFIDKGPVVQVKDLRNEVDVNEDTNAGVAWDGPFGVMVDRLSASASEIFAGAIQDYGRGIIFGTQTYGKGTVQSSIKMDDLVNPSILQRLAALVGKNGATTKPASDQPQLGLINLTMAKFYRVNGSSTQHKGVMPDINFPSLYPLDKIGEDTEKSALPWDTVNKSNFVPVADLTQTRAELVRLHDQRMASSVDYKTLQQDLADLKKREGENFVSLNEVKLKKERDSLEAKSLTKTNMLRSSRGLPPVKKGAKIKKEESFDFVQDESLKVMADLLQLKKTT